MFESSDVLITFAAPEPIQVPGVQSVERLGDHRLLYLDYEGEIAGDRGQVQRWDAGSYMGGWQDSAGESQWSVTLSGSKVQALLTIDLVQAGWRARFLPLSE